MNILQWYCKISYLFLVITGSLRDYVKAEIITEVITETFTPADPDDQAAGDSYSSAGAEDQKGT